MAALESLPVRSSAVPACGQRPDMNCDNAFSGSQLQAAIEFLEGHPGEVSPITLTLGGNDLPILLTPCTVEGQIDLECIRGRAPGFIAGEAERISYTLQQLRSAAPNAEIIVTGAYDSYLTLFAFADPLFQSFNAALDRVAAENRAHFANPFPIFNPQGDLTAEARAICTLTLLCTQSDSHPSDAGYQALADVVFDASQYIRLLK